jgi:hypothetical protein
VALGGRHARQDPVTRQPPRDDDVHRLDRDLRRHVMPSSGGGCSTSGGFMSMFATARVYQYDETLLYLQPPWFPTIGDSLTMLLFRELPRSPQPRSARMRRTIAPAAGGARRSRGRRSGSPRPRARSSEPAEVGSRVRSAGNRSVARAAATDRALGRRASSPRGVVVVRRRERIELRAIERRGSRAARPGRASAREAASRSQRTYSRRGAGTGVTAGGTTSCPDATSRLARSSRRMRGRATGRRAAVRIAVPSCYASTRDRSSAVVAQRVQLGPLCARSAVDRRLGLASKRSESRSRRAPGSTSSWIRSAAASQSASSTSSGSDACPRARPRGRAREQEAVERAVLEEAAACGGIGGELVDHEDRASSGAPTSPSPAGRRVRSGR